MERHSFGNLTGFELQDVQNSLLEAKQRLLTAQYDTKLYEISLMQISDNVAYFLQ